MGKSVLKGITFFFLAFSTFVAMILIDPTIKTRKDAPILLIVVALIFVIISHTLIAYLFSRKQTRESMILFITNTLIATLTTSTTFTVIYAMIKYDELIELIEALTKIFLGLILLALPFHLLCGMIVRIFQKKSISVDNSTILDALDELD